MPRFIENIDKKINFTPNKGVLWKRISYFTGLWFLAWYDRIDYHKNGIQYPIWENMNLAWCELKTSKRHTDKDGNKYYITSNHCYLLGIRFNNPKFRLKKTVAFDGRYFE